LCLFSILRWIINAFVLMIITFVVPGFAISNFYIALISAFILAFVNAVIRPVLLLLTLPINILTLGLFTLVINALMFWFVSTFVKGFNVVGFWPAFWAALIFSAVSLILNFLLNEEKTK